MGADVLAALTIGATYNEMTLLVQKMTDLVLKRNASDGNLDKAMDTAEDIKQCLGRMKLIEEETARLKNAEMSKENTTAVNTGGPVAGVKQEHSLDDDEEKPKPISDSDKTPIAEDNCEPTENHKSSSSLHRLHRLSVTRLSRLGQSAINQATGPTWF